MKNYHPLFAGILYAAGNILIKAIPFLTLPLFTRLMPASDFGVYHTYLAYETIGSILLGFGMAGTVRIAITQYPDRFEEYVSAMYGVQAVIAAFAYLLLPVFWHFYKQDGWLTPELSVLLLSNCMGMQIFNIASAKYAIEGEVKRNLCLSFLMSGLNVCMSLFFCLRVYPAYAYKGRIYGTCFSALIPAALAAVWQKRKSSCWYHPQFWKFSLRMGSPLILHSLSLTVLSQCDKIMIQSMEGSKKAGVYSLAVTLSSVLGVIVTSADNAWAPWFFERLRRRDFLEIERKNSYMIMAFGFLSILTVLVSPELIRLMSPQEYWDSARCFPILLLSVFFGFLYIIPVNLEYYHKKTGYIAVTTAVAAVLNVACNYVFIRAFGFAGAAYATCVSKFLLFVLHWKRAFKIEKIKLADARYIVFCILAVTAVSVFTVWQEKGAVYRYSMLAVMLYACWMLFRHSGIIEKIFVRKNKKGAGKK